MKQQIFALGFFDGVHLGHQALLRQCVALAQRLGCKTAAITFDRHPMAAFTREYPPLLTGNADRTALLRRYGMEEVLSLPVTEEVMSTDWRDFLENLLDRGAAGFVCGDDFRFGHRGTGTAEKLLQFCEEKGLPCVIVPEQTLGGQRISSTHIRRLLEAGRMEEAVGFLGHPHVLTGEVVAGRHLGRTIGVPTANILIPEGIAVPRLGVYACFCAVDGVTYRAVTNVGSRPTVGGHQVRAESWILDFDGDLYGRTLTLEFTKFLRPEQKFDSLEELKAQIRQDAERAKALSLGRGCQRS